MGCRKFVLAIFVLLSSFCHTTGGGSSLYSFSLPAKELWGRYPQLENHFSWGGYCPKYGYEGKWEAWKKFHEYWSKQAHVTTRRCEDLLESLYEILLTILEAMGYDVSDEKIDFITIDA